MPGLPQAVERYLVGRGVQGDWALEGRCPHEFSAAVVIPALAEGDSLFSTLESLSKGPTAELHRTLVIVVVNQSDRADTVTRKNNHHDLQRLSEFSRQTRLMLSWVDASSAGLELPADQAGAGFARKLGMDLALPCLDWNSEPLLISLDADTLVEANYLPIIFDHFRNVGRGAATIPFHHQPAEDAKGQSAIDRYELFLRSHLLGLSCAGSPYAFPTIGSAFACRADSYVRGGGMNRRKAGEDFYFLQQMAKTDGVTGVIGTRVYPSARASQRVPFGTGPSVARQLVGDCSSVEHYAADCYRVLADWLHTVECSPQASAGQLLNGARDSSFTLGAFLEQAGWSAVWPRLCGNHAAGKSRVQAFHSWFDGLKTLRLIHALSAADFPRQSADKALPELLAWCGLPCPEGTTARLELVRGYQEDGASPTKSA
jgi:hypothetical protein